MIILPLGLHAKIYRIPYATICVVLLACYFSLHSIVNFSGFQIDSMQPIQVIEKFFVFNNPLLLVSAVVMLLFFSTYLELRIGSLLYIATYVLGGLSGFLLKTYVFKSQPMSYSVTALCAVMGAYFVLLGQKNYRAFIFIPPRMKKTIYFPSAFFIMAAQAVVILAHLALHNAFPMMSLAGYAVGAILGIAWGEAVFVQSGFSFPIEVQYMLRAKKQFDPLKKIDLIIECLRVNPTNSQAMEYLFRSIAKAKVAPHFFTDKQKQLLATIISGVLKKEIPVDLNLMIYFLSLLPLNWSMKDLGLQDFDDRDLDTIDIFVNQSQWKLGLRLYDVYLMTETNIVQRSSVLAKVNKILDEVIMMGLKPDEKEWVAYYIHHHPNSPVTDLIRPRIKPKDKKPA